MKNSNIFSYLLCPQCGSNIETEKGNSNLPRYLDGYLRCDHGHVYPVIKNIPRLLMPNILDVYLGKYYPIIKKHFNSKLSVSDSETSIPVNKDPIKIIRTMFSFGYQWTTFNDDYCFWQEEYNKCLSPIDEKKHFGKGRIVADIGCGMGRMLYRASKNSARFIGFDLSHAIEAAAELCKERKNVFFVQGDILNPPFYEGLFDTVYSVGVLHHLPDGVQSGIDTILPLLKNDGFITIWLYGSNRGNDKNDPSQLLRKLLQYFPLGFIYIFSYVYALLVNVFFNFPAKILEQIPNTTCITKKIPFPTWRNMTLKAIACNTFDFFATPIEYGYDREELFKIAKKYSEVSFDLLPVSTPLRNEASWHLFGKKQI